jgi:hypothetical protein
MGNIILTIGTLLIELKQIVGLIYLKNTTALQIERIWMVWKQDILIKQGNGMTIASELSRNNQLFIGDLQLQRLKLGKTYEAERVGKINCPNKERTLNNKNYDRKNYWFDYQHRFDNCRIKWRICSERD